MLGALGFAVALPTFVLIPILRLEKSQIFPGALLALALVQSGFTTNLLINTGESFLYTTAVIVLAGAARPYTARRTTGQEPRQTEASIGQPTAGAAIAVQTH